MRSAHDRLRVPAEVASLIRSLHPDLKKKVRAALAVILADPNSGKPLRDELNGLWSYRIGRMRIIYRFPERRTVELVALGPRKTIYEETLRLVKRDQDRKK